MNLVGQPYPLLAKPPAMASSSSKAYAYANAPEVGSLKQLTGKSSTTTQSPNKEISRKISVTPSKPPYWDQHCEETIMSSSSAFKTFKIDPDCKEYLPLVELLDPLQITSAERIVNPGLWERYSNTRRELLLAKSEDLELLSQLGLSQKEMEVRTHLSTNFVKSPLLTSEAGVFSPNEALLFHCTRNQANLDKIFSQGLDDRLAGGGSLGRGIYFSDDPMKSIQYDGGTGTILLFSVLLGDCLTVGQQQQLSRVSNFVREPEKEPKQRRNPRDLFFDSIVARPVSHHNEYVVFNRYQCCPVYAIKYRNHLQLARNFHVGGEGEKRSRYENYAEARSKIPDLAWRAVGGGGSVPMPNQELDWNWPYYTSRIFQEEKRKLEEGEEFAMDWSDGAAVSAEYTEELNQKQVTLVSLGFFNEKRNLAALRKFKGDLDQAAAFLLEQSESENDDDADADKQERMPMSSSSDVPVPLPICAKCGEAAKIQMVSKETQVNFDDICGPTAGSSSSSSAPRSIQEECSICRNEYEEFLTAPYLWKELCCGHKLCTKCFGKILISRATMSKVQHKSVRCPFCLEISGKLVGDCPDGEMKIIRNILQSCEGYPEHPSIRIDYKIMKPYLYRSAYLPGSQGGNEILKLLQEAWDRRLIFTMGRSNTTGQENTLVWNIHHKTSISGGVASHGYPDPGYLNRVRAELKAFGIE